MPIFDRHLFNVVTALNALNNKSEKPMTIRQLSLVVHVHVAQSVKLTWRHTPERIAIATVSGLHDWYLPSVLIAATTVKQVLTSEKLRLGS